MVKTIFQKLRELASAKQKSDADTHQGYISTAADGRGAEIDPAKLFQLLERMGKTADDFDRDVKNEVARRGWVKDVAAGQAAAARERELRAQVDREEEQLRADLLARQKSCRAKMDEINEELYPLRQIVSTGELARASLLEMANEAKLAGLSRDERIERVQGELASTGAMVDEIKSLEKAERHARGRVDIAKANLRVANEGAERGPLYGVPESVVKENAEAFRVATVVHKTAADKLAAARQLWNEFDRERKQAESEVLGLVATAS